MIVLATVVVVVAVAVVAVMVVVVLVVVAMAAVAAVVVTLASEGLRKNVQEDIPEHPAGGEAQQQWLCRLAMRADHVWQQR